MTRQNWWITTAFLDEGGKKVMGPFATLELAIEVRTLRERVEHVASYFVDSEPDPMAVMTEEEFRGHIETATRDAIKTALTEVSGYCDELARRLGPRSDRG